jgi:DivIVA domain-containing protein
MQTNDWLLDSPSPGEVANASFQIVRRGYDPVEVSAFARAVSAELQRLAAENEELRNEVEELKIKAAEGFDEGSGRSPPDPHRGQRRCNQRAPSGYR